MPTHALRLDGARPALLVVAAPAEASAVLDALDPEADHAPFIEQISHEPWRAHAATYRLHLVVSGVGKANASAALALALDPERYSAVVSVGIAGALPASALEPGALVVASRCVYADEGVITGDGFLDLAQMGFPPLAHEPTIAVNTDLDALDRGALPPHTLAPVATVSTCSGSDEHARAIAERTGAACEAMEGAAVAFCSRRIDPTINMLELRVISNTTGDRGTQRWDLPRALDALGALAKVL